MSYFHILLRIVRRITPYVVMGLVLGLILRFSHELVYAQGGIPLPGGGSGALSGEAVKDATIGSAQGLSGFRSFVYDSGYRVVKEVIASIAVVAFVYMGIQMVIANNEEERITKARKGILMIVFGLAIIALADSLTKSVFVMSGGTFLGDNTVTVDGKVLSHIEQSQAAFNERIGVVITFVRYLLQGIAFFFVVRSGLALIVAGQDSETLDRQKKVFSWGLIGFIFIMVAEPLIKQVIFPVPTQFGDKIELGQEQIEVGTGILTQIINFILAFAGGVAVFALIAGAVMYSTAIGNQESTDRGKKIVVGSIMGMVIIYSAYTIVAEFVS